MKGWSFIYIIVIIINGGDCLMVIILGNGYNKLSSNPRWSCLHFT